MKCPECSGEMKKKNNIMEQDGLEFEAYLCPKCGEEIMNMKQLKVLADKYRSLRKAKEIVFAKWGNSLAVRIPRDVALEYKISEGKRALLVREKEGIKITQIQ